MAFNQVWDKARHVTPDLVRQNVIIALMNCHNFYLFPDVPKQEQATVPRSTVLVVDHQVGQKHRRTCWEENGKPAIREFQSITGDMFVKE